MLKKHFIMCVMNVGNDHWVTSYLCNPWYTMVCHMKKKSGASLVDELDNMDQYNDGLIMFGPIKGFLAESQLDSSEKSAMIFLYG